MRWTGAEAEKAAAGRQAKTRETAGGIRLCSVLEGTPPRRAEPRRAAVVVVAAAEASGRKGIILEVQRGSAKQNNTWKRKVVSGRHSACHVAHASRTVASLPNVSLRVVVPWTLRLVGWCFVGCGMER